MPRFSPHVSIVLQRKSSFESSRIGKEKNVRRFQMLVIANLEERWLQLHKQRADTLVNRRQEDVKDQGAEYPLGKAAAMVAGTLTTNDFRTPLDPKRQRRATEREARR